VRDPRLGTAPGGTGRTEAVAATGTSARPAGSRTRPGFLTASPKTRCRVR
jgi:hypothetical protein